MSESKRRLLTFASLALSAGFACLIVCSMLLPAFAGGHGSAGPSGSGGGSGTISSGTTGYLPKYTGATTIGDSTLEDAGAGEVNVHVGALQATLNFGGMAANQYYTFPDVANANLTGNTVAVLAPSLSLNGGNRLAGVAVSAPTFSSGSVTSNVATINTTAAHGLTTGDVVTISSSTGVTVDGTFRVTVTDADTFTFAITVGNGTITAATITPLAVVQLGSSLTNPSSTANVQVGGSQYIEGDANEIQWFVQGKSGQTAKVAVIRAGSDDQYNANPFTVEDSTGLARVIIEGQTYSMLLQSGANGAGGFYFNAPGTELRMDQRTHLKWSDSNDILGTINVGIKRIGNGVLGISNGSSGGGIIEFPDVASLGTVSADSARIGSIAGEMWVKDAAGNATQISPHAKDSPGFDPARDQPQDIVIQHFNAYLGKWEFVHLSRFVREYEAASGKQYIYEKPIAKADWNADQQKLQDAYDAERAKELAAKAEHDAKPAKVREATSAPVVREAKDVKKPMPDWMRAAQGK